MAIAEDGTREQFGWTRYFQPSKRLRQYLMLESIATSAGAQLTQRQISTISGISPSVVNQYLGQFESDQWIARASLNQRDYRYTLTEQGDRQRREMLIDYIRETFQLFSAGKSELTRILREHESRYAIKRLIFYTAGEVTELLLHALQETSMELMAIVDDDSARQAKPLFGYPIISANEILNYKPDAVIVTSFRYRQAILTRLADIADRGIAVIGF